jgi:hypothetical protein
VAEENLEAQSETGWRYEAGLRMNWLSRPVVSKIPALSPALRFKLEGALNRIAVLPEGPAGCTRN